VTTSVAYTALLSVREHTVLYLAGRLRAERTWRGTRRDRRALGCFTQAVLVLRWLLDNTRITQLAADNAIGKHCHHGGNIQVISSPDGWPLWTSDVRPGREHDLTCLKAHPEILAALREWTGDHPRALADLGYEGQPDTFTLPVKKPKGSSSPTNTSNSTDCRPTPEPAPAPNKPTRS
jgi:hypothetical protein